MVVDVDHPDIETLTVLQTARKWPEIAG